MGPARDRGKGGDPALSGWRRWLRLPRRLRPTRAGWIFFALTFGVAFAALNTGNNLLYLMLSLMLAFLALSGVFSEAALRGIEVRRRLPREIVAGEPARVVLEVTNAQRRAAAFAVAVEDRVRESATGRVERAAGRVFLLRIGPRETRTGAYAFRASGRGELEFTAFHVYTRFPFGLFQKSLRIDRRAPALAYPPLVGVAGRAETVHLDRREEGSRSARGGPGDEARGLRAFAEGDSARRIQWRASLRRGALLVRDLEPERDPELEIHVATRGRAPGVEFEQAVSSAAVQVVEQLGAGRRVALRTDATRLPAGTGARQRERLLVFLARVEPGPAGSEAVS